MRVVDWVLNHKARSGLIAVAFANLFYYLWSTMTDTPMSPFFKLLTPFVILSTVILTRMEGRKGS